MNKRAKKFTVKLPKDINAIYSYKKKMLTLTGPVGSKSLKLDLQLSILKSKNILRITSIPFFKISNNKKKKITTTQGTTTALIGQLVVETSALFYQKLKFIGIGYRTFNVENFENKLLLFKIGYSHLLYFKIPNKIKIFCLKTTKLIIYGNSYQNVTQTASLIRSYKKPEPYKGKGILYETEKINLKKGKKI